MLVETDLGTVGRTQMRSILSCCPGAASRLADIICQPGKIFAPLPPNTPFEGAQLFNAGGISSMSAGRDWLFRHLASQRTGVCIFQEVWLTARDVEKHLPRVRNYFTEGDCVYYYIPPSGFSYESVVRASNEVRSFQSVGFYLEGVFDMSFEQRRCHNVPPGFLGEYMKGVRSVFISAYDLESWIVWQSAVPDKRVM